MTRIEQFIKLIKGKTPIENFEVSSINEIVDLGLYKTIEEAEWSSSSKIITEIFTKGACGRFALILKFVFPEGEIFKLPDESHIVFKLNNRLYDINGDVTDKYKGIKILKADKDLIEDLTDNYSFSTRGPII